MAVSSNMIGKLNEQIASELFAQHLYLSMVCRFEAKSLKMLARLFRKQQEEEREHAMKILEYVHDVGGEVKLQAIPEPKHEWNTPLEAIEAALAHEKKVTGQIHALAALADQEKDYATRNFLEWFISEQVEEEEAMTYLRDVAKMAKDNLLHLEAAVAHLAKD